MKYVPPGLPGSIVSVEPRYENFIGLVGTATASTRPVPRSVATRIRASAARTHLMMLDHYSQTKNLLVSYSTKPLGLF
jgi:hypothetical protein